MSFTASLNHLCMSSSGANASACLHFKFPSLTSRLHFSLSKNKLLPFDPDSVKGLLTVDM